MSSPSTRRALLAAAAAAPLVVFAYFAVSLALVGGFLGHDEAIYATGARSWVEGFALHHYPFYRPVGMRLLAAPGWLAGGGVDAFRMCAAAYATLCFAALWMLGRRIAGGAAATIAIATLATSVEVQLNAAELLSDLPSLALIFVLLWIVIRELERDGGPRWPFVLAGPLAAASYYVRYGSTMILVMIAVSAALLYAPIVKKHWRLVAITAGVFAVCMIPHLVHSKTLTGTWLGIVRGANQAAGRRYYGEGLWFLYRHFPDKPGGLIVAVVALIGLGSGLVHLVHRRTDATHRRIGFVWLAATLHTLAVGFDVHGQARFVFFGAFLYTILGAHALVRLTDGRPRRRVLEVALPAIVALWLIARESHRDAIAHNRRDVKIGAVVHAAADAILADAGGEGCAVMSPLVPEMTWLTRCEPFSISSRTVPDVFGRLRAAHEPHAYVVTFSEADRNPKDERLTDTLAECEPTPIAEIPDPTHTYGDATVYRVKP